MSSAHVKHDDPPLDETVYVSIYVAAIGQIATFVVVRTGADAVTGRRLT